jgi:hypothetical protein
MSFLDYFRGEKKTTQSVQTVDDPLWGTLIFDRPEWWVGECDFEPTGHKVQLIIQSAASGATEDQHKTYLDLTQRYEQLLPRIGEVLFELWRPWLEHASEGQSEVLPRSAVEMLEHTQLETIWLDASTFGCSLALGYGFATDGIWDDASMNIGLDDWVPRGLGVDD